MKTYYKGASAALIIYDITREETFLNLENEQKLTSTSPVTQRTSSRAISSP
jgi:GTPase SAR1 family protein